MLTDEPVELDRRVQFFLARYRARGKSVDILNLRTNRQGLPSPVAAVAAYVQTVVFLLARILPRVRGVAARVKELLARVPISAYETMPAMKYPAISFVDVVWPYFRGAMARRKLRGYGILHANDLRCLIYAVAAAGKDTRIFYDSHEFNPFRRRPRMSWLRLIANSVFEDICVQRASSVVTVSPPIADAFGAIYGRSGTDVVENRFFSNSSEEIDLKNDKHGASIGLFYFGSLAPGRALQLFNQVGEHPDISAVAMVYDGRAERSLAIREQLSNVSLIDEEHLGPLSLPAGYLRQKKTFSWCILERVCLSYVYALPNKFFQSLALELPLIVAAGTYLGDLVEQNGIGLSVDPATSAAELVELMKSLPADRYAAMQKRTRKVADQYKARDLETIGDRCVAAVLNS